MGAAEGGENKKRRQNTLLTVPNLKFGDVKLELRLREPRPDFQQLKRLVLWSYQDVGDFV